MDNIACVIKYEDPCCNTFWQRYVIYRTYPNMPGQESTETTNGIDGIVDLYKFAEVENNFCRAYLICNDKFTYSVYKGND